jgi:uncharacterized integral membrane protein
VLHRLLLLPLLSPLLVTLLVAALNPRPSVALRLLTWQTPALPIGLWMAMAAGGGAALSGGATALALRQGSRPPQRRTVRRSEVWDAEGWSPPWRGRSGADTPGPGAANRSAPAPSAAPPHAATASAAGPSRAPGEPAPTVSVPFRVLHRPQAGPPASSGHAPASPPAQGSPHPAHGTAPPEPDWGEVESEEW